MHHAAAVLCALLALGGVAMAGAGDLPPVEQLPAVKELPNPFIFRDGTRVKGKEDWQRRREELKELIQHYGYGHLPAAGGKVRAEEISSTRDEQTGATERRLLLRMGPHGQVRTHLVLTLPEGKGPFPAVIVGDLCWGKKGPEVVAEVVKRGYLLAEFDRTEVAPDKEERGTGLYAAYPEGDFGALAAWAWGFHRVVDVLLTLPEVDARRIAVTGHSRGGKAALLAGALDERIALTAPNNSGCMGAGCTRVLHGNSESLQAITRTFPFWFTPRLAGFVGKEDRLPFDQHSLKALVAPRALLSTEGMDDHWANPPGTQLTYQAAKMVYDFLGAGDRIGIVFREGGHGHTLPDWQALLDFADQHFRSQRPTRRFDRLAYPDESAKAIPWKAPKP